MANSGANLDGVSVSAGGPGFNIGTTMVCGYVIKGSEKESVIVDFGTGMNGKRS